MPSRDLRNSRIFAWEYIYLVVLMAISLIAQRLLSSGCCNGPDFVTYLGIAQQQMNKPDFWMTPDAFNGNFWAMLYPTFLHFFLMLPGATIESIQWFQMILAATLAIGGWLLLFQQSRAIRLTTASVIALSPTTIWIGNSLGYEVLLAWFLTFALAIAWKFNRSQEFRQNVGTIVLSACSGLLMSLAVLTQSKSIVVLPVILYLLWKRSSRLVVWNIIGFLFLILPWAIRNLIVLGNPSIATNNGAYNLWIGNNPAATFGGSMMKPEQMPEGASAQLHAAIEYIVSQPEIALNLVFRKAMRLWEPLYLYPEMIPAGIGRTMLHILAATLTVLVLLGFVVFVGGRLFTSPPEIPDLAPLALFVILFYLTHLPFIAEPRFMTAVYPVTAAVAIPTLFFIWKPRLRRLARR